MPDGSFIYANYLENVKVAENALAVYDSHPRHNAVNHLIHRHTAVSSTVASAANPGDYDLILADASSFSNNDLIQIGNGSETNNQFFYTVISKSVNTLTLDAPLDSNVSIGALVEIIEANMNVNGAVTPVVFKIEAPLGIKWHLTRLMISMTMGTAGDLSKFGNLAALSRGVHIRGYIGGVYRTLTNWKTNEDIHRDFYDFSFDDRAGGGGIYGLAGRGTFTRLGVAVPLDSSVSQDDRLEVIIQDNLTGLLSFYLNGQGYVDAD